MNTVTAQSVNQYLNQQNYLSLAELAAQAETTSDKIRELERAHCIPATSYLIGGEMSYTSSFGTYKLPVATERYYHPSILGWTKKALKLAENHSLDEVAKIVRADFDQEFHRQLEDKNPPWPGGADYAWNFIIDGTWGLCLQDISVKSLLTKEFARSEIRAIIQSNPNGELNQHQRAEVMSAIEAFESVALPFSPHEVKDSCRHREIEPALKRCHI